MKMSLNDDENFMREALKEAELAARCGDVPVGAVVTDGGKIIARGHNRREALKNALLHAETEAIGAACAALGSWRLDGCSIYVTLEPCPMCAGAIIASRIARVVIGAPDPRAGACGSVIDLFACPFSSCPDVRSGVLKDECSAMLGDFFTSLRVTGQ
jgi:tRNA(adenine34) deaminase